MIHYPYEYKTAQWEKQMEKRAQIQHIYGKSCVFVYLFVEFYFELVKTWSHSRQIPTHQKREKKCFNNKTIDITKLYSKLKEKRNSVPIFSFLLLCEFVYERLEFETLIIGLSKSLCVCDNSIFLRHCMSVQVNCVKYDFNTFLRYINEIKQNTYTP